MNLFLHDIDDANIVRGDTLRNPLHLTGEEGAARGLQTFDRVLANPPFSLKEWGQEVWSAGDKFGRDRFGCPPTSYGDLAFVQHMIASLKKNGMLGVVLPLGFLFRGGAEGKIRKGILEDDLIEAIIGIAPNLFYGTGIAACILVINKNKSAKRKGNILFVNRAKEYKEGSNQNSLSEENVKVIVNAFHDYKDVDRFSRVVDLKEIESNDFSLNFPLYIPDIEDEQQIDIKATLIDLNEIHRQRDEAEAEMMKHLKELGYGS